MSKQVNYGERARCLELELYGLRRRLEAAERLCRIYFEIAARAIGEDEVRRQRDAVLNRVAAPAGDET